MNAKKILIVEDELLIQMSEKIMLKNAGFEVTLANDGLQAIELATSNHYDIIFMDIGLPDLSGIEVTKKIRDYEKQELKTHSPIIIALTAHPFKELGETCQAAGMNAYIQKPLSVHKIDKLVQTEMTSGYGEIL